MSSVDDRIVNMQFNNKQFQTGAADSTKSLQTLETTINGMSSSTSSGLSSMGSSIDQVSGHFSALKVAGVTALATLVNKATTAGINMVKSLTLDPIAEGFDNYETKINAVQTILSNTQAQGTKLKDVTRALAQLNTYANKTVFNFAEMARNIGTFTAAGVDLKTSTASIKGIANLAALSGSTSQQASTAMYQLSQAIAAGQVHLQDWNSVVNAGIGGAVFQKALVQTAQTMGTIGKNAVKTVGPMKTLEINGNAFRNSLTPPPGGKSWLTTDVLTKTLAQFTGDMTNAQLASQGFTKAQIKNIQAQAKSASQAATQIKTFSQLFQALKEEVGSAWGAIFEALFGNIKQAKAFLSPLHNAMENALTTPLLDLADVLKTWRANGGFTFLLEGLGNIFKTLGNLIHPFVAAFKTILPATGSAGKGLASATKGFAEVTGWIEKLSENASVLTPVLVALFGVFKDIGAVGLAAIKGLAPLLPLLNNIAQAIGGMVKQGADIGASLVAGLLKGMDPAAIQAAVVNFANNIVEWIKGALGIHSPAAELVPIGLAIVQGIAEGIINGLKWVITAMGQVLSAIFSGIDQLFGGMDAIDWASLMNALLTGGLLLALRGLTKTLNGFVGSLTESLDRITSPFAEVTKTLKTMQQQVKAKIILDIAIAVGILTASLIALSLMDPKKIAIGLGALSTMIGELVGALAILSKIKPEGLFAMGSSILLISTAMLILSAAVAVLGNLDMKTLAKGMGALAIGLGIMVVALTAMAGLGTGLPAAAAAIFIMTSAMTVLSAAVLALGKMSLGTLAKGLGAIAIGLTLFTAALLILSEAGPAVAAAGAGIFIVASAMVVMAGAVAALGKMGLGTLAKGLGAMAIGLAIFVVALGVLVAMGPEVDTAAAAILIMSAAMLIMAKAIGVIGGQSLGTIAKGLGALALGFVILLAAAAAAIELAPGLIVLGVSVAALGLGLALAGAGLLAAATAFSILAVVGTAGIAVLVAGFTAFMALLPEFALQLAASVVTFVQTIAAASGKLREAFGKIIKAILGTIQDAIPHLKDLANALIGALLDILIKNIPKVGQVFQKIIDTTLGILRKSIPEYVDTGLAIILGILQGINKNLPKIIKAGTDIIVNLIEGLGKAALKIEKAAADTVITFINGLADAIEKQGPELEKAGLHLAEAIINGLTGGLLDKGISAVEGAMQTLADHIPGPFKKILGILSPSKEAHWWGEMIVAGLVKGITDNIKNAVGATIVFANAVVAAGNKAVASAQRDAEKKQIAAEKASARARVSDQLATAAEREAKQNPKNKALQKAADAARKAADRQAKLAQAAQKKADAASQHVSNVQQFQQADAQGKGDILSDQAKALSERAIKMLAQANAEAIAAKKLQGKQRQDMLRAARQDAKAAKDLADKSKAAQKKADDFYAQSVQQRIKQIEDARKADAKAQAEQALFDNATDAEKADILQKRADKEQKQADRMQKQSDALIKQAKKLAKTDAAKAQRLLDKAEQLAQDAKDSAEQAKQDAESAKQAQQGGSTSGSDSTGFQLSRTALEDAAKAIDRYTKSLQDAEADVQARQSVVQFVQNNSSPTALSESEIYRQTKNLLTTQEVKMGAPA